MNIRKLIFSTVVGGFGMWIIAGVWHNLIMANLYKSVHATHDGFGLLLVAYLILALLMSYIYPLGYKGEKPIIEGLRFGILIGILWVFPHDLAMAGAHNTSVFYAIKNGAWHIVEQGVGGAIIGLIYGRFQ